jgi:pimeloyl-ACP methyl ester carboxylesterase
MGIRSVATAVVTALAVASCAGDGAVSAPAPSASVTASTSASVSASTEVASEFASFDRAEILSVSEEVGFRGAGGVDLEGRVFGSGDVGVVLAHMRPGDQSQWIEFAALLADHGYLVLTYDHRGVCPGGELGCSSGKTGDIGWEDLAFAVELLRARGASRVVVGGASLGAMESLYALTRGLDADGLIWLSGADLYGGVPVTDQVRAVRVPKLLATGEFDSDAVELRPAVERAASPPKHVVLLDTGEHGTNILEFGDPAVADVFRRSVLDFLATI